MAFASEIPAPIGGNFSSALFAVFSSGQPWLAFVAVAANRYNCHGKEMNATPEPYFSDAAGYLELLYSERQ